MNSIVDAMWVAVSAALVFFMQPGFSMVESGLTREKNSINVAIKNLTDIGISLFVYWLVGFAFMFGTSSDGFIGRSGFIPGAGMNIDFNTGTFLFFQAMFCSTSATIVSGAVAERMKYSSYIISTFLMSLIIYPIFGHWAWAGIQPSFISDAQGWLYKLGFVDFAGSTVVHSVGGYVGLAGIIILGARKGRFPKDEKPRDIQGCDVPMTVAGVFILWFGWLGFNGGSTLAFNDIVPQVLLNTCIGAATGMLSALFVGWAFKKIPDVNFVINGTLAGLVSVTANCHCVTPGAAAIIGAVGGIVMLIGAFILEKLKLDDAVGAVPVHLCAGVWGTLAVGIFGQPELLGTNPIFGSQFLAQFIGVTACGVWAFGLALIGFWILNKVVPMRVSSEDEDKGLNIVEHGASTEIFDVYAKMKEQAVTGDLSVRLPVEPFTEIGQISSLYNDVMQKLEESSLSEESFGALMKSIPYALFMIDAQWNINPQYSESTPRILGCPNPENYNFLLLMARILPRDKTQSLKKYLENLYSPDFKQAAVETLNPIQSLTLSVRTHELEPKIVQKVIHFEFSRIFNKQKTKVLHVIVQAK
ncbi:MAG: ammonium transporter [Spirochaetaceae bacterium]|nr:ammonium transporter [Spirochaetaceae bacterium]